MNESELFKAFAGIDDANIEKAFLYQGKERRSVTVFIRYAAAAAVILLTAVLLSVSRKDTITKTGDEIYNLPCVVVNGQEYGMSCKVIYELPEEYTGCVNDEHTGYRNVYYSTGKSGLVYVEMNNADGIYYEEYLTDNLMWRKYIYINGGLYTKLGKGAKMPSGIDEFTENMEYLGKAWISDSNDYPDENLEMNGRVQAYYDGGEVYLYRGGIVCIIYEHVGKTKETWYSILVPVN